MQMSVCVWLSPCAVHLRLTMNGILNQLYFNSNKGKNLCRHFLGSWQYVPLSFGQDLADVSLGQMTLLWVVNLQSSSKGPPRGFEKWTSFKKTFTSVGELMYLVRAFRGFMGRGKLCSDPPARCVTSGKPHSLLPCRLGAGWAVTMSCHLRKRSQLPSKGVKSPGSHGAEEKG